MLIHVSFSLMCVDDPIRTNTHRGIKIKFKTLFYFKISSDKYQILVVLGCCHHAYYAVEVIFILYRTD